MLRSGRSSAPTAATMKHAHHEVEADVSARAIFNVVADISSYPLFLSYCDRTEVLPAPTLAMSTAWIRKGTNNPSNNDVLNDVTSEHSIVDVGQSDEQNAAVETLEALMDGRLFGVRVAYRSKVWLDRRALMIQTEANSESVEAMTTVWKFSDINPLSLPYEPSHAPSHAPMKNVEGLGILRSVDPQTGYMVPTVARSNVDVKITFAFRSKVLNALISQGMLRLFAQHNVEAFVQRARALTQSSA